MPYPTTTPSYSIVKTAIQELLAPITYLLEVNGGGGVTFAADPSDVLLFSDYMTPALVFTMDVEEPAGDRSPNAIGGAVFPMMMHWSAYVISASFSVEGGGALEGINIGPGAASDPGAHAMIDDLFTALVNKGLHTTASWPAGQPDSKIYIGSPFAQLHHVSPNRIVYRTNWRNQWIRVAA